MTAPLMSSSSWPNEEKKGFAVISKGLEVQGNAWYPPRFGSVAGRALECQEGSQSQRSSCIEHDRA